MLTTALLVAALAKPQVRCADLAAGLAATDASAQQVASEKLYDMSEQGWEDAVCIASLNRILLSTDIPADTRFNIVWAATVSHHIASFRPAIEHLLQHEPDQHLRESFAQALVIGLDDEDARNPTSELINVFLNSSGIVQREATLQIAEHSKAQLPPAINRLVVTSLIDLMTSDRHPAITRGRAIQACQYFAHDDADITEALLLLSRSNRWFNGVQGPHYLQSSIVSVIHALGSRQCNPAVAKRLHEISSEIYLGQTLTDFEIWLCEGALNWAYAHAG